MESHTTETAGHAWQSFMKDGDAFLRRALASRERPKVFTPSIVYNIAGMAIEKHVMAALLAHGKMPNNHTFRDLVEGAATVSPLPDDVADRLLDLERFQDLCPLQGSSAPEFTAEDVSGMLEVAEAVQRWAKTCATAAGATS